MDIVAQLKSTELAGGVFTSMVVMLIMIILAIVTSSIASKDTVLIASVYLVPLSVLIISSMIKTDIGGG